jgi:anti-anti-sigma factor
MEIKATTSGDIFVLEIHGRLDTTNYMEFEKNLLDAINGNAKILIDSQQLEYISSSGLRALLVGLKNADSSGKKLALCSLQPVIMEIFKISAFISLFKIYPTREEAIKSLT